MKLLVLTILTVVAPVLLLHELGLLERLVRALVLAAIRHLLR